MTPTRPAGERIRNVPERRDDAALAVRHTGSVPAPPRPTIVDVARAAGVSKSLVSAALRGEAGVSAASRERVAAAADQLGYRTNGWAQRLVSGRSDLVGVLLTDLRNEYHTDIVNGIEDAAHEAGFGVILSHGRRDRRLLLDRLQGLIDLGVDAVIAVTGHLDAGALAAASARVPLVVVGRPESVPDGAGWVRNNDEEGARLAVAHVLSLGHERIGFVQGSARPASRARRGAYRSLVADPREFAGAEEFFADGSGLTAVFATNDRLGAELLAGAADRGRRVPDDLAVVGYDNTELSRLVRPALTSVDQPRGEMGTAAMAQALALLGSGRAEHLVVAPTLVVRGSTVRTAPLD